MEKTKKQILLFIIIILVGVGYVVNVYMIAPKKLLIQEKSIQIQADKQKLNLLNSMNSDVANLNVEIEKLKQDAQSIEDFTVKDINTPQLIFDFYSSCKDHGIKGENLVFQLADGDINADKTTNETADITDKNTDKNTDDSQTEVVTEGVTTENTTDDISEDKVKTGLLKLTIDLKVSGDKDKVEDYIRSLNTLTSRKINVKSIKLEATVAKTITGEAMGETTSELTNEVTADIIFNQYIFSNGEEITRLNDYSFYDENIGYSNFADMFK